MPYDGFLSLITLLGLGDDGEVVADSGRGERSAQWPNHPSPLYFLYLLHIHSSRQTPKRVLFDLPVSPGAPSETMITIRLFCTLFLFALLIATGSSFQQQVVTLSKSPTTLFSGDRQFFSTTALWDGKIEDVDGVVELADADETVVTDETAAAAATASASTKQVAPFLSQGEILEDSKMDLSDPKQARVMFYIILSLLPVLFLIPLMLGSREMIPADMLPPVQMN